MRRAALFLLVALAIPATIRVARAVQDAAPIEVLYPDPLPVERIRPILLDDMRYVSTGDVARIFRATKYWRPELRKLSLRFGDHTIRFTVDALQPCVVRSALASVTARTFGRWPRRDGTPAAIRTRAAP